MSLESNRGNVLGVVYIGQVRAQLDEDKNIVALVPRQPLEVHETVAECMIYTNHWVARKIQESFPQHALLRHHPPPRQEFFSQLVDSAKSRGFTINTRWGSRSPRGLRRLRRPTRMPLNQYLGPLERGCLASKCRGVPEQDS